MDDSFDLILHSANASKTATAKPTSLSMCFQNHLRFPSMYGNVARARLLAREVGERRGDKKEDEHVVLCPSSLSIGHRENDAKMTRRGIFLEERERELKKERERRRDRKVATGAHTS